MKSEAMRIVGEGSKRDLHVRLLGAIAFQTRCPKFSFLTLRLNRVLSDVDFAAYSTESPRISGMMRELGYEDQPMITALFGDRRTIWDNRTSGLHVDIFLDKLEMNHDISFQNRLDIDPFTIPLEEMLLEKMQIVRLEEKDIVDTTMLLREHEVGGVGQETINARYIAKLLSNDWGFYYTFTNNMGKVKSWITKHEHVDEEDKKDVCAKIDTILQRATDEPKSFRWEARSKIGTKKKWYNDVESLPGRP